VARPTARDRCCYLPREVFFGRLGFAGAFFTVWGSDFGRFLVATSDSFPVDVLPSPPYRGSSAVCRGSTSHARSAVVHAIRWRRPRLSHPERRAGRPSLAPDRREGGVGPGLRHWPSTPPCWKPFRRKSGRRPISAPPAPDITIPLTDRPEDVACKVVGSLTKTLGLRRAQVVPDYAPRADEHGANPRVVCGKGFRAGLRACLQDSP